LPCPGTAASMDSPLQRSKRCRALRKTGRKIRRRIERKGDAERGAALGVLMELCFPLGLNDSLSDPTGKESRPQGAGAQSVRQGVSSRRSDVSHRFLPRSAKRRPGGKWRRTPATGAEGERVDGSQKRETDGKDGRRILRNGWGQEGLKSPSLSVRYRYAGVPGRTAETVAGPCALLRLRSRGRCRAGGSGLFAAGRFCVADVPTASPGSKRFSGQKYSNVRRQSIEHRSHNNPEAHNARHRVDEREKREIPG